MKRLFKSVIVLLALLSSIGAFSQTRVSEYEIKKRLEEQQRIEDQKRHTAAELLAKKNAILYKYEQIDSVINGALDLQFNQFMKGQYRANINVLIFDYNSFQWTDTVSDEASVSTMYKTAVSIKATIQADIDHGNEGLRKEKQKALIKKIVVIFVSLLIVFFLVRKRNQIREGLKNL